MLFKSSIASLVLIAILVGAAMTALFMPGTHAMQSAAEWERSLHGLNVTGKTGLTFAILSVIAAMMVLFQRMRRPENIRSAIRQMDRFALVIAGGFAIGLIGAPSIRWQASLGKMLLFSCVVLIGCAAVYRLRISLDTADANIS